MIEAHALTHTFDRGGSRTTPLSGVTHTFVDGTLTYLLGLNGTGKSTLLRCLGGVLAPNAGTVVVDGRDLRRVAAPARHLSMFLDVNGFHPTHSGRRHLRWLASLAGVPAETVEALLEQTGLAAVTERPVGGYSLGMRQRLGIAAAMIGNPRNIVLDEPINGLDVAGVLWLRGLLREWAEEGRCVVVASHNLAEVERTADAVLILDGGRIAARGAVPDVRGAPGLAEARRHGRGGRSEFAVVLARAVRAESVRLGGSRGVLVRVAVPLGLLLPMFITLAVAVVSERLTDPGGLLQVQQVRTTNSVYWLVYLGVTVFAVAATYAQGTAGRRPAAEVARHAAPRPLTGILARWLFLGGVAAAGTALAAFLVLITLPALFPEVYGTVAIASAEGARFLWALPIYAFLASGLGVGIGALVPWLAASVTVLTIWSLFIEGAVMLLPGGGRLIGWMPFLNGIYASGQEIALSPTWGRNGALAYVAVFAMTVVALGWARLHRERRNC